MLTNADTEERWHWHRVEETPTFTFLPSFYYDDECITVCLPLEYRVMKNYQIRKCMETLVQAAYGNRVIEDVSRTVRRFLTSNECLTERRKIIISEADATIHRVLPKEFHDAMALHPGLRKCLDGMAFAVCDTGEFITRSDYLSRTIIVSREVFNHDDRLLRTYIVFRELASCLSVHPMSKYGMMPAPELVVKFMIRFPNWEAYEGKCRQMGWAFRYKVI